eukprot:scaffold351_cov371-Prasinococcus_capsulatus_cf.AAC.3
MVLNVQTAWNPPCARESCECTAAQTPQADALKCREGSGTGICSHPRGRSSASSRASKSSGGPWSGYPASRPGDQSPGIKNGLSKNISASQTRIATWPTFFFLHSSNSSNTSRTMSRRASCGGAREGSFVSKSACSLDWFCMSKRSPTSRTACCFWATFVPWLASSSFASSAWLSSNSRLACSSFFPGGAACTAASALLTAASASCTEVAPSSSTAPSWRGLPTSAAGAFATRGFLLRGGIESSTQRQRPHLLNALA